MTQTTFQHTLTNWLQHLTGRGYSRSTISHYTGDIRSLFRHLLPVDVETQEESQDYLPNLEIEHGPVNSLSDVTSGHLTAYLAHLRHEHHYADRTIQSKTSILKAFFSYVASSGLVSTDPSTALEPSLVKTTSSTIRQGFSDQEIEQLLNQVQGDSWLATRDRAIIHTFLSTGLQVGELVTLNLSDLSTNGTIHVTRRSQRRIVPLNDLARREIGDWLGLRENRGEPKTDALFITYRTRKRLYSRGVQELLQKYAAAAGLTGVTPIALRHTFVTRLYEHGVDWSEIQTLLGTQVTKLNYGIVEEEEQPEPNYCIDCGIKINFRSTRCRKCASRARWADPEFHAQWYKAKWPSRTKPSL